MDTPSLMNAGWPEFGQRAADAPQGTNAQATGPTDRSPFAARLSAMQSRGGEAKSGPAREAANKLIASAFIIPALQSLRESSLAPKDGPFAPNIAQKRFGPILDQHIADRIVTASNFGLTDTIVDRVSRPSGGAQLQADPVPAPARGEPTSHVNIKG